MLSRSFRRLLSARKNRPVVNPPRKRQAPLWVEQLEIRDVMTAYTPGNLVILQAGDSGQYNTQGPLYLNESTTAAGQTSQTSGWVQQTAINNSSAVGGHNNQPITIDLTAAAGNGQLDRTADGAGLVFGGVDSGLNNGGYTLPQTPTGNANRVIAVTGNDPASSSFINTTTFGPFYVGDDNRGGVASTVNGPVWSFGHPNQAGGAVSQGVLYFPGPNGNGTLGTPGNAGVVAQTGVQVSNQANIRGGYIGFNNVLYWTTAGSTQQGLAGIYQSNTAALPVANASGADTPVVKALFAASKVGGMYLADTNGDGVLDTGDRIYLLDDGTVGGVGTGGLYMAVYNPAIWGVGGSTGPVTGQTPGWSPMVRIAEGVIGAQPTPQPSAQLRGLAGTVLADGSVQLYATQFDNVAGNNSYVFGWNDNTPGVLRVNTATHSGATATLTLTDPLPAAYRGTTVWLSVNSVSTGGGNYATDGGYNGVWNATVSSDGTTITYTDNNTLPSGTVNGGSVAVWLNTGSTTGPSDPYPQPGAAQIIQTFADGTLTASASKAEEALRGIAFAPVAATSLSNFTVNGGSSATVSPGTNVTFSVNVSNPESGVTLTGLPVTFIDVNTGTVIGQGFISGGVATFTTTTPLVGNHIVSAYFAGGGAQALAPSNAPGTVTVNEAGSTTSTTALAVTIGGSATTQAAVGRTVTLTATVPSDATGTVSFYNGTTLLGSANVSAGTATLTTSFSTTGSASITATYNGNNTYAASTSTASSLAIGANATATITSSANNVAVGATPTYTVTVTNAGSFGAAAGTVQFFMDGTALGAVQTLNGSGVATVSSTALTAGSHLITVAYTPTSTSPYNNFTVTTSNSGSGLALIETAKQPLTPGNLLAVQRGDGGVNLGSSGYLVFLDEYTPAGVLVQRIALPNTDAGTTHALLLSGQNGAEGLINKSGNGQFLTIIGYDVPVGQQFVTSTFPYQFGRTIARIDANGNVDTSTVVNTTSPVSVPYNSTDVVSNDGNEFWISTNLPTGDTTDSGILYTTLGNTGAATQLGPVSPTNYGAASIGIYGTGSNAQVFVAGSKDQVDTVGSGLPTTAGQSLTGLTNLDTEYNAVFPTGKSPEQIAFLNTNDGSSNNPNVAYVADQAYGLLKFWKDNTGNWHLGQLTTHTFGEKLVFSGGATGVVATMINPGTATAKVNIYVTGSNVQQANPNQIAFFQDLNGAPAGSGANGVDQGFSSGSFSTTAFVGGTQGQAAPSSPNGNMNFAGLAFVPGFVQNNLVVSQVGADQAVAISAASWSSNVVTIATGSAHGLLPGQQVTITGMTPTAYNGTFTVTTVPDATHFTYALTSNPGTASGFGSALLGAGSTANQTFLDQFTTGGLAQGQVTLPTAGVTDTITSGSWSNNVATIKTANSDGLAVGQTITVAGMTPSGYNGVFTIASISGKTITYVDPQSSLANATVLGSIAASTGALTEGGSSTGEGYLTDSADGHSLAIAGYNQLPGYSTSGVNRVVGLVNAAGAVDISTQLPQQTGSVRVAVSADGLGFWIATGSGVRYIPFGGAVQSAGVTAASWASGIVTVTANNNFTAGQLVNVAGITPSGYNGTFTIVSASATSFTYALSANPGSTSSVVGATATIVPTQITAEVGSPTTVGIVNGQLWASAGAGAQSNGVPALDSPFQVSGSSPLPTNGGQAIVNPSTSLPTARDSQGNFPSTNQFWVSPDGRTILIADSREDGSGGLLEYYDTLGSGSFTLLGHLQLDSFSIASASQSGTTVTINTTAPTNFVTGESVQIAGVTVGGSTNNSFNTSSATITVVSATQFTFTVVSSATVTADANSGVATNVDGGLRALVFDPTSNTVYATTTATSGNRLVKITGVTTNGTTPTFAYTTLSTAAAETAYRGVAFSPTNPGTTASTTSLAVSGSPASYGTGLTLTATVTAGATGWVSFRNAATGAEIGAAPINTAANTATLVTAGNLFAAGSAYSITATYTGDGTFAPSTSAAQSGTVSKANTTTAVAVATTPIATGVNESITATVTVPVGTLPTNTVSFFDGGTQIGTAQAVGQTISGDAITFTATLTTTFSTTGTHTITAQYSGDGNFNGSTSSAVNVLVVNPTTTVVTSSNANPTGNGGSVSFTATVTSPDTTDTIAGSVQFYDDLLPLGSAQTVSGVSGVQASITVSTALIQAANKLTPGLHSITAVYTPDTTAQNTFFTSGGVYEQAVQAQAFGATDEFVYRTGDGTTGLIAVAPNPNAGNAPIGSTVYIDEYTTAGTLVQSIILPSADGTGSQNTVHAVVGNGQQSATGQLSLSGDGQYLFAVGYDANPLAAATAPALNTNTVPRSVARIKYDGTVQTEAFTAGSSGVLTAGNINGVYSPDGNKFYLSGAGSTSGANGVVYFSSFTPSASLQNPTATITGNPGFTVTGLELQSGNLVAVGASSNLIQQYTGLPTAAATLSGLSGINTTTDANQVFTIDAFFAHENGAGAPAGINTLYLSDDGPGFANGHITKWALGTGGTWTLVDTVTAGTGNSAVSFYWMAGKTDGSGNVALYTTYGQGGNSPATNSVFGALYSISDTNGYNAPIGTGGSHSDAVTTLASVTGATSLQEWRGVALTPQAQTTTLVDNGPNPSTPSQTVSLTATVASPGTGNGPTGTLQLEDASNGNANVGSAQTLTNGTVTFNVAAGALTPGTHNLFVAYSGDTFHQTQNSNQVAQVVVNPITVVSINVNAGTDPIISASNPSTGVLSFTTDGPCSFAVNDPVVIAGVNSSYNGSYTVATVGTNSFTVNASGVSGLATVTNSGTATDTAQAGGELINGATSATSQRSMVDSIVYKFNQAVNLGANAFTVTVLGQGGQVPTVSYASADGGITWAVTFSGTGVTGNSIADGEYQIVLNASAVSAVSGGGTLAANDTESFYRLYGDTVGNGHYRVNSTDNSAFVGAFNSRSTQAAFLAYLDFDNNGRINSADNSAFTGNFNRRFSGFTATI